MIRMKKWERYQHYKHRSPPWIKLHSDLLDNPAWHHLGHSAARLLVELWLLASKSSDGTVDLDAEELGWRLRRASTDIEDDVKELVEWGFVDGALAPCKRVLPQRERERESRERERESKTETCKHARATC